MAVKKINETTLAAIGNAIRTVLGVDTTYKPSQMAAAINSIRSKLGSKSITSNGTYTAASQDLMGFSQVVVWRKEEDRVDGSPRRREGV